MTTKLTTADIRDLKKLADGSILFRDTFGVLIGNQGQYKKASVSRLNKFLKAGYIKTRTHTTLEDTFVISDAGHAALRGPDAAASAPVVTPDVTTEVDCDVCGGWGTVDCQDCEDGYRINSWGDRYLCDCDNGKRECRHCKGTGKLETTTSTPTLTPPAANPAALTDAEREFVDEMNEFIDDNPAAAVLHEDVRFLISIIDRLVGDGARPR